MIKSMFSIDDEPGVIYPGYTDELTAYMGFEDPSFELAIVLEILKDRSVEYTFDNDTFNIPDFADFTPENVYTGFDIAIDGEVKHVYNTGQWLFIWNRAV